MVPDQEEGSDECPPVDTGDAFDAARGRRTGRGRGSIFGKRSGQRFNPGRLTGRGRIT